MNAYQKYLNEVRNRTTEQYGKYHPGRWANTYNAAVLQEKRDALMVKALKNTLFKGTKPYHHDISEGCRRCGEGTWSCLFITGRCNASCFYCPAAQDADEVPVSQGLHFPGPAAYAEYVRHFGFRAVAFSGGEPLLYYQRVMDYLRAVRKECSPELYAWMYTNGILGTREIFAGLADAGINEVRFDIGATNYNLDKLKLATGVIPVVTVEIPAIPEHFEKIIHLLPELEKSGVKHLNLHQLRLTPHNARHLLKRDYTYVPAEKPIVAESEITALEVLEFAERNNMSLGVNYCSFHFKHRFQQAGFRTRIAGQFISGSAELTEQGYVRETDGTKLTYTGYKVTDGDMSDNDLALELSHKSYSIQKFLAYAVVPEDGDETNDIARLIDREPASPPEDPMLFNLWRHEYIETGLREY